MSADEIWLRRPADSAPEDPGKRDLGRKPLINLEKLQAWLSREEFDVEYDFWAASDGCWNDLQTLQWRFARVVQVIKSLHSSDYHRSMWCLTDGGWFACYAYRICFDEGRNERRQGAVRFYLKFSLDDSGDLVLVLVSAHTG